MSTRRTLAHILHSRYNLTRAKGRIQTKTFSKWKYKPVAYTLKKQKKMKP